jgi:8-oxo-dGTP pyrophosphatase MutT (NUDIX family)
MGKHKIRPLAIGIFRRDDRILVCEGYDPIKQQTFYRPLGGGIEFGERAAETVTRELQEEIGAEMINPRYLGTLENLFTYNGKPGHEIVLVFAGELTDPSLYERETWIGHDGLPGGEEFKVVWKPLADFAAGQAPLYPDGLLPLLEQNTAAPAATHER